MKRYFIIFVICISFLSNMFASGRKYNSIRIVTPDEEYYLELSERPQIKYENKDDGTKVALIYLKDLKEPILYLPLKDKESVRVFFGVETSTTNNIYATGNEKTFKTIIDGRVVIIKGENEYNLNGILIK